MRWWMYGILVYAAVSLVTFVVLWLDKRRAVRGRRRVSERALHRLEWLGGFPGSLAGQKVIRHKNRKQRFYLVTWGIAIVHAIIWGAIICWPLIKQ